MSRTGTDTSHLTPLDLVIVRLFRRIVLFVFIPLGPEESWGNPWPSRNVQEIKVCRCTEYFVHEYCPARFPFESMQGCSFIFGRRTLKCAGLFCFQGVILFCFHSLAWPRQSKLMRNKKIYKVCPEVKLQHKPAHAILSCLVYCYFRENGTGQASQRPKSCSTPVKAFSTKILRGMSLFFLTSLLILHLLALLVLIIVLLASCKL